MSVIIAMLTIRNYVFTLAVRLRLQHGGRSLTVREREKERDMYDSFNNDDAQRRRTFSSFFVFFPLLTYFLELFSPFSYEIDTRIITDKGATCVQSRRDAAKGSRGGGGSCPRGERNQNCSTSFQARCLRIARRVCAGMTRRGNDSAR